MGLTIHYQLKTGGQVAHARNLVQRLRQAALDLPFDRVGELIELRGQECEWQRRANDDPYRWLLIQSDSDVKLPRRRGDNFCRTVSVAPTHLLAFTTFPGDGCEQANFGLCRFPAEVSHPDFGTVRTKLRGWSWQSFCKTHYASDPRCGGLPHFLKCHLSVVALLDIAKKLRCLERVSDEGEFWETRSLERLTQEVGEQSAMIAGLLGQLQDAWGATGGTIEAPIRDFPNFEHLEAEGQKHLPALLKALAEIERNRKGGA